MGFTELSRNLWKFNEMRKQNPGPTVFTVNQITYLLLSQRKIFQNILKFHHLSHVINLKPNVQEYGTIFLLQI